MVLALKGKGLSVSVLVLGISEVKDILELYLNALVYRFHLGSIVRMPARWSLVLLLVGGWWFRIIIVTIILWVAIGVEEGDVAGMRLYQRPLERLRLAMRTGDDVRLRCLFGDGYIGALGLLAQTKVRVGMVATVGRKAFHLFDRYFGLWGYREGRQKQVFVGELVFIATAKSKGAGDRLLLGQEPLGGTQFFQFPVGLIHGYKNSFSFLLIFQSQ